MAMTTKGPCSVSRGLTLWQPMAWAISDFTKRIENRPWKPWSVAKRIAIHAGKTYKQDHAIQIAYHFNVVVPSKKRIPLGAIVAVADIVGGVTESDDPWFSGPYGWQLDNVVKMPQPIECSGAQGLWRLSPDVRLRVEAQMREVLL